MLSAALSAVVTGSFLVAFLSQDGCGGSVEYLDGNEKILLDINIGVLGFGFGFAVCLLVIATLLEYLRPKN